jgi:hypothetical protein
VPPLAATKTASRTVALARASDLRRDARAAARLCRDSSFAPSSQREDGSENNDSIVVPCSFADGEGCVEVRLRLFLSSVLTNYGFFLGSLVVYRAMA